MTSRQETARRDFLRTAAGATAGMASWLALGKPPALAQKRELTLLSYNHFVPPSDDELRRQAEAFGKQAGVTVRVDTIANFQLPAKHAAEAASQSGHAAPAGRVPGLISPTSRRLPSPCRAPPPRATLRPPE
jgi:hypothetical protein